jgi:glycosyltransferase involved in cell wall biosynthesis
MMKRYFFIVCLKYAPGMWQHMNSFASSLLARGYPVRFIISPGYRWMTKNYEESTYVNISHHKGDSKLRNVLSYLWLRRGYFNKIFRQYPPSGILLSSWHPLNFLLAQLVKSLYPDTPIMVWLHEPYKDEKKIYGAKAIIIYLVELFQTLSLRYTDVVIVHSQRGFRLFKKKYPRFKGRTHMVPLQFQDDGFDPNVKRRYVSFLGRADLAKGIEAFFSVVEDATQRSLDLEFQIVTASNIKGYLERLSPTARQKLRVVNKPQISDADLREAAANSLAVLALYKETMQSGVIPVAFMQGTPVIGTDIEGITEWVRNKQTGVIVSRSPASEEIEAAIAYIQSHLKEMVDYCRADFLSTFDDRNWERYYGWLGDIG